MNEMWFEISDAQGRRESVRIEGARASIGSAAHCDVRLPVEDAGPEQVRATLEGGELHFQALLAGPAATLDGAALAPGQKRRGSELCIGRVRLFARAGAAQRSAPTRAAASRPLWVAALAACLLLAVLALLARRRASGGAPALDPELTLFSPLAPSCPRPDPLQALAFARQQRDLAETQQERMPFVVEEGLSAVDSFETAAACFSTGGAPALAEQASSAAERLKGALEDELRARRLRLSRMLLVGDRELARADVTWLRALLRGKSGAYVRWLDGQALELGAGGAS
ncbi:MAG TPA: hypothetical protein VFS67_18885 [Polyangiaceae bacterium]|nr:hypothetical protein [Polyangiaceae bacterium]